MTKIYLIQNIYALKERKEKELIYYKEKLAELQSKIEWAERELVLTIEIIRLIEEEKIKYKEN